jgi:hypothetical protein
MKMVKALSQSIPARSKKTAKKRQFIWLVCGLRSSDFWHCVQREKSTIISEEHILPHVVRDKKLATQQIDI